MTEVTNDINDSKMESIQVEEEQDHLSQEPPTSVEQDYLLRLCAGAVIGDKN